jgi:hypothetical protein
MKRLLPLLVAPLALGSAPWDRDSRDGREEKRVASAMPQSPRAVWSGFDRTQRERGWERSSLQVLSRLFSGVRTLGVASTPLPNAERVGMRFLASSDRNGKVVPVEGDLALYLHDSGGLVVMGVTDLEIEPASRAEYLEGWRRLLSLVEANLGAEPESFLELEGWSRGHQAERRPRMAVISRQLADGHTATLVVTAHGAAEMNEKIRAQTAAPK